MSNQAPLMNPAPKERFMAVPSHVHQHRETMVSDSFERAADLAMLQHMARCTQNLENNEQAAAAAWRIAGALEYALTLRMLGEAPQPIRKLPLTPSLDSETGPLKTSN